MIIDENYIEFLISIWRNVPVVNTKLYRFTFLHPYIRELFPLLKIKVPYRERITVLYIKILTVDWQIKGIRNTIKKKLGLTTFGSGGGWSQLSGDRYFRDLLAATKSWR